MMTMHHQVEDVQDQKPVFLNAPYSDTVEEGTAEGTEIFSVQVQAWFHPKFFYRDR